jgi:hypothetical protein
MVKEGKYGGCILSLYYENRIMKPVEIVLRSEASGMRENDVGGESN